MLTILIFIAVLFILVLAHECGHFFAAKRAGVAVEEFGFSFPPRLFGVWRDPHSKKFHVVWGSRGAERATSTLYSFNLIPLGGFVKIKGEDGEGVQDPNSFAHKSAATRAWILCAGVLMNLIVAAVLLSIGFGIGMPTVLDEQEPGGFARIENRKLEIVHVFEKSAAATAGLKSGDQIIALDDMADVHFNSARDYFRARENQNIKIEVMRNGQRIETTVTPAYFEEAQRSAIGVALAETALVKYPWYVAPLKGIQATGLFIIEIFRAFGGMIVNLVRGAGVEGTVAGPIGIAIITGEAARLGASYLLQFIAVLSLNLAVLNILPIPALDGGRLLFVVIEKIRRGKKTRREIERIAHSVGFFALIALVVVVTVNDLGNYSEFFKQIVEKLKSMI